MKNKKRSEVREFDCLTGYLVLFLVFETNFIFRLFALMLFGT